MKTPTHHVARELPVRGYSRPVAYMTDGQIKARMRQIAPKAVAGNRKAKTWMAAAEQELALRASGEVKRMASKRKWSTDDTPPMLEISEPARTVDDVLDEVTTTPRQVDTSAELTRKEASELARSVEEFGGTVVRAPEPEREGFRFKRFAKAIRPLPRVTQMRVVNELLRAMPWDNELVLSKAYLKWAKELWR